MRPSVFATVYSRNAEGRAIYVLPQDIIDNTVRAFSVSATSVTDYGQLGPPTGRHLAPANGPDCIELAQENLVSASGACGTRTLVVTGPRQVRFDLSVVKRVPVAGRVNIEFRGEFINAFNHPWFAPVTGANANNPGLSYSNPDTFRVTSVVENSSRIVQVIWRMSW